MAFPYTVQLNYGDEKRTYADTVAGRPHPIGTRGTTPDGRVFYFALNGGTALEGGRLVQAYAPLVGVQGTTTQFVTVGATLNSAATTINLLAATQIASGQMTNGWLMVQTTPARALYHILKQTASGGSAGISVTLDNTDYTISPITTAHRLALVRNIYSSVIVAPAPTLTGGVVGVSTTAVAASRWFWCQTAGPCSLEYNAGFQAAEDGHAIQADTSVAGAFQGFPNSSALPLTTGVSSQTDYLDQPVIGWVDAVTSDGFTAFVHLNIRA